MEIIRVYSDADGESHIQRVALPIEERSAGGGDWSRCLPELPVTRLAIRQVVRESDGFDFHNAPRRQLVLVLSGSAEIQASDGTSCAFGPGDIVFVEDVSGRGHRFRGRGSPRIMALLPVPEDFELPT